MAERKIVKSLASADTPAEEMIDALLRERDDALAARQPDQPADRDGSIDADVAGEQP